MIHLTDITKHYGDKRALGPVSFEIPQGSTVGFLGLNGVGKTTLLRILACDLRPTAGVARVAGVDVLEDPHAVRARVGYLPENPPLYQDMTVGDYLRFAGRIKGLDAAAVSARVREVEEATDLSPRHDEPIRHLSHGYRQRVGVAQALIHDPDILILDEPTNGLDPVQIREMRELIGGLRGSRTILISSHILPEISKTCDQLLILHEGEIVGSGSEEDLSGSVARSFDMTVGVRATSAAADVLELLTKMPGVADARVVEDGPEGRTFQVEGNADVRAEVCRALVEAGHDVIRLDRAEDELEGVFVKLVTGSAG